MKFTPYHQEEIVTELVKDGYKARISTTGWLLVSGRRTSWSDGYNMAFLGWQKGMNPPKIERTFYAV
jgi:hypothetical protein